MGMKKMIVSGMILFLFQTELYGKENPRTLEKTVETKESTVDIQGKKFRKIELQKETFFIEALDSEKANAELRVLCQQGNHEVLPAQLTAGVQTTKRSGVIIESMRQVCKEAQGGRREVQLDPSILVGLQIGLDSKAHRRVIVTPVGVTFKADW